MIELTYDSGRTTQHIDDHPIKVIRDIEAKEVRAGDRVIPTGQTFGGVPVIRVKTTTIFVNGRKEVSVSRDGKLIPIREVQIGDLIDGRERVHCIQEFYE